MQDLGDELLQYRLQKRPAEKTAWLDRTIDLLADLHVQTFPVPKSVPVTTRAFDTEKYVQEFTWTQTYLCETFLKVPFAIAGTVERFSRALEAIEPWAFSHRDFHTRNLLVHEEKLWLIDFQDARMGPPHYDLASLIYDPYNPLDEHERDTYLARYRARVLPRALGKRIAWDRFEADLNAIAFQRVIKAAGSFASFFVRNGKDTHLRYIRPALETALALQVRTESLGTPQMRQAFRISDWLAKVPQ